MGAVPSLDPPGRPTPESPRADQPYVDDLIEALIAAYDHGGESARASAERGLRRAGVAKIEPAAGDPVDEAVHIVVTDHGDGTIVEETERPGWIRKGVLLRRAEVVTR